MSHRRNQSVSMSLSASSGASMASWRTTSIDSGIDSERSASQSSGRHLGDFLNGSVSSAASVRSSRAEVPVWDWCVNRFYDLDTLRPKREPQPDADDAAADNADGGFYLQSVAFGADLQEKLSIGTASVREGGADRRISEYRRKRRAAREERERRKSELTADGGEDESTSGLDFEDAIKALDSALEMTELSLSLPEGKDRGISGSSLGVDGGDRNGGSDTDSIYMMDESSGKRRRSTESIYQVGV